LHQREKGYIGHCSHELIVLDGSAASLHGKGLLSLKTQLRNKE